MKKIYETEQAVKIVKRKESINAVKEKKYRERKDAILFDVEMSKIMKDYASYEI